MEDQDRPERSGEAPEEPVLRPADDEAAVLPDAGPDLATAAAAPELVKASPSFVYALGQIDFRYPNMGLEREIAQVIGRSGPKGMSDREAVQTAISLRGNRYLARDLCWVFLVEGIETYILFPRDPADYELLIEAIRKYPTRDDADLVIGTLGDIAPPEMCNGLAIPMVAFDQIYSFDRESLTKEIPTPDSATKAADKAKFRQTAGTFFEDVMKMADNAGAMDEHRALNYLAVRYPRIYTALAEEQARNASLGAIETRHSPVSDIRRVVDVIFSFTHRETDVTTKHFARVDVTDLHPFLMTPLSPYYDLQ